MDSSWSSSGWRKPLVGDVKVVVIGCPVNNSIKIKSVLKKSRVLCYWDWYPYLQAIEHHTRKLPTW